MHKILLSPKAIEDLEEIFDYTVEAWSFNQAVRYQDELFEYFNKLSMNTEIGEIYYFKTGNYRKLKTNKHLIFYTTNNDECIIMRILHEQMNLKTHF